MLLRGAWLILILIAGGCQTSELPTGRADAEHLLEVTGDADARVEEHSPEPVDVAAFEGTLTLQDAVRRAMLHDPRLQAALAQVQVTQADAMQARLLPNPILSVSVRM